VAESFHRREREHLVPGLVNQTPATTTQGIGAFAATDSTSRRRFVLSIDGGGFRGLACLLILQHVMTELVSGTGDENTLPAPCQVFDMICGTGTGGLIAILLGRFGLSCVEAIKVYKELGLGMFGDADSGKIWGNIVTRERFPSKQFEEKLAEVVERYTGAKDSLMKPMKDAQDKLTHDSTMVCVCPVHPVGPDAHLSIIRPS
jgi:hypothetical protein